MNKVHFNVLLFDGKTAKVKKDSALGTCFRVKNLVSGTFCQKIRICFFSFLVEELDDSTPMKINGYEPTNDEWPAHGVLFERERLLKGLDDLMKMDVAEQFRAPGREKHHRRETFLLY